MVFAQHSTSCKHRYNHGSFSFVGKSDKSESESVDELSTGAVVTISIVVTFIVTFVVTALITYIITSMYYKHLIDCIRKSVISQEGDLHEDTKRHDPAYATTTKTNITIDTNPAYGTATAIKTNADPAYVCV